MHFLLIFNTFFSQILALPCGPLWGPWTTVCVCVCMCVFAWSVEFSQNCQEAKLCPSWLELFSSLKPLYFSPLFLHVT